ncbi:MAG TPA: hypothetical protein VGA55_00815, partial [Bacteroidota bacterium]
MVRTFRVFSILSMFAGDLLSSPTNDYAHLLESGDRHYRNFDNLAALEDYRRAYELAPNEFEPLVRMIRIHNDIGRSMLRNNDSAEVWYLRAVDYAEELMEKYPQHAESYFWLALAKGSLVPFHSVQEKLDIGKFVVRHARKAVEIDSTFGPAYVVLGILYREAARLTWYEALIANVVFGGSLPGTIDDSEAALRRAIALNPNDIFA